ncbi:MAG: C-GCAxxG-C-C family protein [Prolixibacteraceae bacterium]|jgi:C_GCAxxG_C_C family probable redox protein|nr:C-GCAxxG-C-C family protein [Prolixibacteraceae bacterium]
MKNNNKAIHNFSTMNCNQSVLAAFGPKFGVSEDLCFSLGLSFGGGMGKQGKTCGAVTGAYTVIGLWSAKQSTNPLEQKNIALAKVQEYNALFEKKFGSIECKTLLKYDMTIAEDLKIINLLTLFDTECPKFVGKSAEILDVILIQ